MRALLISVGLTAVALSGCGDRSDEDEDTVSPMPSPQPPPPADTPPAEPDPLPQVRPPQPDTPTDDQPEPPRTERLSCEDAWKELVARQDSGTHKDYEIVTHYESESYSFDVKSTETREVATAPEGMFTEVVTTTQHEPPGPPPLTETKTLIEDSYIKQCKPHGLITPRGWDVEIVGYDFESVEVPAGTFDTEKTTLQLKKRDLGWQMEKTQTFWYMRDGSGILVKSEEKSKVTGGGLPSNSTTAVVLKALTQP